MYDGPEVSSIYWPDPDYKCGKMVEQITTVVDMEHSMNKASLWLVIGWHSTILDSGIGIKRRLTMDYAGNLGLYSLN